MASVSKHEAAIILRDGAFSPPQDEGAQAC
jgi:hypothetical protein